MNEKYNYIGVFLNEESKKELLETVKELIPENWKIFAHHLTIYFNANNDEDVFEKYSHLFGTTYSLKISAIGISNRAIAAKVDNYPIEGKVPHITIAVAPEAKPVESNYIENWNHLLAKPMILRGALGYFSNGEIKYI